MKPSERLRRLRAARVNWSQIARTLDPPVDRTTVRRVAAGQFLEPRPDIEAAIAAELGRSVDEVFPQTRRRRTA